MNLNIIDFQMIYYDISDITASYFSKITTPGRLSHYSPTKPKQNIRNKKKKEKKERKRNRMDLDDVMCDVSDGRENI